MFWHSKVVIPLMVTMPLKTKRAPESSQVYGQFDGYVVKDLRKSATFYYDPINYSGFDSVSNPAVTEPMVEFVLELKVKFSIAK
jgi:hypothetical protein